MRRVEVSERLLSLFTTRERAAAIIGDLLEAGSSHLGFWFAVARIAFALAWRSGLGIVAAAAAQYLMMWAVNWSARAPHPISQTAGRFGLCAWFWAMAAAFSLVRFGPARTGYEAFGFNCVVFRCRRLLQMGPTRCARLRDRNRCGHRDLISHGQRPPGAPVCRFDNDCVRRRRAHNAISVGSNIQFCLPRRLPRPD